MSDTPRTEQTPMIWTNLLMFVLTFGAAVVLVPWYGLTHGFTFAEWCVAILFTGANGMADHRRLSPPVGTPRVRGALVDQAAASCSLAPWRCRTARSPGAAGHRKHHLHVDDIDNDPYSARRGFWFSHIGWMLRDYPSGRLDFANVPDLCKDPMLAFQHRSLPGAHSRD